MKARIEVRTGGHPYHWDVTLGSSKDHKGARYRLGAFTEEAAARQAMRTFLKEWEENYIALEKHKKGRSLSGEELTQLLGQFAEHHYMDADTASLLFLGNYEIH